MTLLDSDHRPGMGVQSIHHIEIYVSNNYQAAHFYRSVLGFRILGQPTPALPQQDCSSIEVGQGNVALRLTAPLAASSPVAEHIRVHGEGVKDIALTVGNLDQVFQTAVNRGARPLRYPAEQQCGDDVVRAACIASCGDLTHSLIEQSAPSTPRPPLASEANGKIPNVGFEDLDHVALALSAGELDSCVDFYVTALGFRETHQEQVNTEYSAMRSKVVQAPNGGVRFPIMEPAPAKRKSQIEAYVESHEGPGTQHLAFRTRNIVQTVSNLAAAGIEFLPTPDEYYTTVEARVGPLYSELDDFRRLGILVDRDAKGLLFQVFTKPIGPRPTLFLEIIERRGAEGFGSGNIKALFEAVERSQARKGAVA